MLIVCTPFDVVSVCMLVEGWPIQWAGVVAALLFLVYQMDQMPLSLTHGGESCKAVIERSEAHVHFWGEMSL